MSSRSAWPCGRKKPWQVPWYGISISHAFAIASALGLGGCATLAGDGMELPSALARSELHKDAVALKTDAEKADAVARVAALARGPLNAEKSVQIALLNNRGLQAAYNELGIAEAIRLQQSLPPNPSISFSRMAGSAELEVDRQIVTNILSLVTLPTRSEIAATRFRQAQFQAALETFRVATEARRAFYKAVAARQAADLLEQATSASGTAAELAKRLNESGALNKLDRTREEAFHVELTTQAALAKQRAVSAREQLVRWLGIETESKFKLPSRLPTLPAHPLTMKTVEQTALDRRLDLQSERANLKVLAKSYGLTKSTRFINVLEGGYADKFTKDKNTGERSWEPGFTLTFEVPIFDFGEARLRQAEERYMQAVNRLAQDVIEARSQARESYKAYRSAYGVAADYQKKLLPLRSSISDELMLQFGAMQVDVFTLLTDARQKIAANRAAVDALRDYWLASTDLTAALYGVSMAPETNRPAPAAASAAND
jgi:outer membrane protein TolC